MLGMKRAMREEMRKAKVYPICRNLDYLQDDEDISSIIFEIVQLTMGDEDPNTPVDDALKEAPQTGALAIEDVRKEEEGEEERGGSVEVELSDDCSLDGVD
jgi:hypothetical protein